ncbi:NAD(P)-dependent dehydrogenase (short-subunit alcohol dehydrogenase family) [Tamaricihabitans halophyticus]|uniref:NAD(P)-dependent dehydrogenase (Short-subunit alcohol dehydrogenase family) n=1 Tax=Tamaricihabitans halophyticus TaxID=1262583 RepID=A0A4R2Q0F0_9PSEU|nr:SDR family NAD(P)-dependent oxidoreductase [Tamaricihabitans halophyticus]TCP42053.1 NAD(P)-dependent dehydrogenase (short-subunit alcohol dehydrogenase family) [Tamaricihabitans halophyticus]
MAARLSGKVAMVTGAAYGIGSAITRRFVAEGAEVLAVDVAESAVGGLVEELGRRVASARCDVAVGADVQAAVRRAVDTFGGLDIVVNNAAVGGESMAAETTQSEWERVLSVGIGGLFHTIRHATPAMRERGGGAFVNLSSMAASRAMLGMAPYAAAKAGVEAITRCAALELRADGIRVNAIAPGLIRTPVAQANAAALGRALSADLADYVGHRQGRWGEPDEVAKVAVHLACAEASLTTGQTYVLDNGATALA